MSPKQRPRPGGGSILMSINESKGLFKWGHSLYWVLISTLHIASHRGDQWFKIDILTKTNNVEHTPDIENETLSITCSLQMVLCQKGEHCCDISLRWMWGAHYFNRYFESLYIFTLGQRFSPFLSIHLYLLIGSFIDTSIRVWRHMATGTRPRSLWTLMPVNRTASTRRG